MLFNGLGEFRIYIWFKIMIQNHDFIFFIFSKIIYCFELISHSNLI